MVGRAEAAPRVSALGRFGVGLGGAALEVVGNGIMQYGRRRFRSGNEVFEAQ